MATLTVRDAPAAPTAPTSPSAPLDLPRLVMKRAALVALLALVVGLVLGFASAGRDIKEETGAALALSSMLRDLSQAALLGDAELAAAVDRARADGALRHVDLRIVDARGVTRLAPAEKPHEAGPWLDLLMTLHARWQGDVKGDAPPRTLRWPVARPAEASPWVLELTESREGERREAMAGLGSTLLVLALASAGMLAAMAWNVRRAFAPLRLLVGRIALLNEPRVLRDHELASHEPTPRGAAAVARERLPAMPIRELQVVAEAVQRLDDGLTAAEAQRRELSLKVLTLQEDERARLARELHDELGQRLTALRVDLAWLGRRLGDDMQARDVVDGMAQQCGHVQQDLRTMLRRLSPLAPSTPDTDGVDQLTALLVPLVASWSRPRDDQDEGSPTWHLRFEAFDAQGQPQPWPGSPPAVMPGELQRAVYRMTQEAMTNVARHAQAARALIVLSLRQQRGASTLAWCVEDDGVGLPNREAAFARGSGLAGMRERAWAYGAELSIEPVHFVADAKTDASRPGLRLAATFLLPRAEPNPR